MLRRYGRGGGAGGRGLWLAALAAVLGACAGSQVMNVVYQLPPVPAEASGRAVAIAFEDARRDPAFLTPAARRELEWFADVFSLTVYGFGRSELRGAFEAGPLFRAILRERLEAAGVRTAADAPEEVRLILKEFRLDYGDRKFTGAAAFDVVLTRAGEVVRRQSVNGSAERTRILARSDAEKTVGDLVSEAFNKLDLAALLSRSGP